ncbi:hypothetical protein T484DRAFT_1635533, partial [Baffinella frigidus]
NPSPETQNPKPVMEANLELIPAPSEVTRNPKSKTRNPKPETRNPRQETRHPKPETRNPKPETLNGGRGAQASTPRTTTSIASRPTMSRTGWTGGGGRLGIGSRTTESSNSPGLINCRTRPLHAGRQGETRCEGLGTYPRKSRDQFEV